MTRSIRHGTALTSTTHTSIRPTVATFKADSEREPNRCFIKIEECRKSTPLFLLISYEWLLCWHVVGYRINSPVLIRVRGRHLYCGGACLAQIVGGGTTPR